MKTIKFKLLIKATFVFFALCAYSAISAQGISNLMGTNNNSTQTGGMNKVGDETATHLSFDNNEVQARNGTNASTFYANYYGGDIDLLGAFNASGNLLVDVNGMVYVNSTNSLGLGTASPSARLDILHNSGVTNPHIEIRENAANDYARINFANTGSKYWALAGAGGTTDKFNIFYNDGTTGTNLVSVDPSTGINMENDLTFNNASNERLRFIGANNWMSWYNATNVTRQAYIYYLDGSNEFRIENDLNGPMNLRTNSSTRIHISGSGEVGIGDTTPDAIFDVEGTTDGCNFGSRTGAAHGYVNTQRPSGSTNSVVQRWRDNTTTLVTVNDMAATYAMTVSGSALASGGTWTNSDSKLKENVSELGEGTLSKVMRLKPSSYTFRKNDSFAFLNLPEESQFGFLAQELELEFPEVVKTSIQTDADGEVAVDHELKAVNYEALVPVLTKAIQEQQAIIEQLRADVEELKKK